MVELRPSRCRGPITTPGQPRGARALGAPGAGQSSTCPQWARLTSTYHPALGPLLHQKCRHLPSRIYVLSGDGHLGMVKASSLGLGGHHRPGLRAEAGALRVASPHTVEGWLGGEHQASLRPPPSAWGTPSV